MSESPPQRSGELRIVAVIGREFDRVIERDSQRARRPLLGPRARRLVLLNAIVLLAFMLLTTPGQQATAWVGKLVGIGEVGGPPTQKKQGVPSEGPSFDPVVVDNGTALDGTRYEWVAYRCLGVPGEPSLRGFGFSLNWPTIRGTEAEIGCAGPRKKHERIPVFESHRANIVPSQFKGVKHPDVLIEGTVGAEAARRVRVIYRDARGKHHDLAVDFARVNGKLRERVGEGAPAGTFVAFIPGKWAARDELESRLDFRALVGTGKRKVSPIARRERAAALRAFDECRPLEPDPNALPDPQDISPQAKKALERANRPLNKCLRERLPRGPIEYVAYDKHGRVLDRMTEPLIANVAPPPKTAAGHEQPGDKRWRRPTNDRSSKPVVLLRARAPEGALYEFFATQESHIAGDRSVPGDCIILWWPYVWGAIAGGGCGEGFPPRTFFGPRNAKKKIAARPGLLNDAASATKYRVLRGFARPYVRRVRVFYQDRHGRRREAPVRFANVRGPRRKRLNADKPFGYFVAFVSPATRPRPPIEVIAYNKNGKEASRYKGRG